MKASVLTDMSYKYTGSSQTFTGLKLPKEETSIQVNKSSVQITTSIISRLEKVKPIYNVLINFMIIFLIDIWQ